MDRRIVRTRTAIFNAVFDLLVEKDASKITVLEVCQRADINKSTFYLHYNSMGDCIQRCFQAVLNGIAEISKHIIFDDIRRNPQPIVDKCLDEIEKNLDFIVRFKNSEICGKASKVYKDNLVASIVKNNGFTPENNYIEIALVNFAVSGCYDTVLNMSQIYNREELKRALCAVLKSRNINN